ncbi:bifunctional heptose 7-phosphate kinase/heptose 1-phosphate adenyltransferase [Spirosoma fluminis]
MNSFECTALFDRIGDVKVGVIGDFALDLYYSIQTETGECSIETGEEVHWASQPKASLGAAGNVVQNLAALGIRQIYVFGCVGNDLFGREIRALFQQAGVQTKHLLAPASGWDTCVYTKPMQGNRELNRIDFGIRNELTDEAFNELLVALKQALAYIDVLILNQQFANPLLSQERVDRLNGLVDAFPNVRVVADMRHVGRQIQGAILKVNTVELARFLGQNAPDEPNLDWCLQQGQQFRALRNGPLIITRGAQGILYLDEHVTEVVDGLRLEGELDTVGAGDTVVAALAACMGAGAEPGQALEIANLAAAVTVQKLQQTGTASPAEILALQRIYSPHE